MSAIDESKQFVPLSIAVLTISDTRSLEDDKSGTTLSERLIAAGHHLAARESAPHSASKTRVNALVAHPTNAGIASRQRHRSHLLLERRP